MLTRYERLKQELETTGEGSINTGGSSMTPIFPGHTTVTMWYRRQETYSIDDIVFCKCKNYVDAHWIIATVTNKGYLIANNHGHQNGWTHKVYGRVVKAEWGNQMKTVKTF